MSASKGVEVLLIDHSIPKYHNRIVLEYVGSEEVDRQYFHNLCAANNIVCTDSICNGAFHSIRTMLSMWETQYAPMCRISSLLRVPTDGSEKCPLRVVKDMRERRVHYTCEELKKHCNMTLMVPCNDLEWRVRSFLYDTLEVAPPQLFKFTWVSTQQALTITSTLEGWQWFMYHVMRQSDSADGEMTKSLYEGVKNIFYLFYPKSDYGIMPNSAEREQDQLWRA